MAARTCARSPSKRRVSLASRPSTMNPNHTVPTGLAGLPPVGPATPVTATAAPRPTRPTWTLPSPPPFHQFETLPRITGSDWAEGGFEIAETVEFARRLKKTGFDFVCVSSAALVPQQKMKSQLEGLISNKDEERRKIGYLSDENNKLKSQIEALRERYETDKAELLKVITI